MTRAFRSFIDLREMLRKLLAVLCVPLVLLLMAAAVNAWVQALRTYSDSNREYFLGYFLGTAIWTLLLGLLAFFMGRWMLRTLR